MSDIKVEDVDMVDAATPAGKQSGNKDSKVIVRIKTGGDAASYAAAAKAKKAAPAPFSSSGSTPAVHAKDPLLCAYSKVAIKSMSRRSGIERLRPAALLAAREELSRRLESHLAMACSLAASKGSIRMSKTTKDGSVRIRRSMILTKEIALLAARMEGSCKPIMA
jgi:hypothetical protein